MSSCPQCGYPAPCGRCDYDERRWDAILDAPHPPRRRPSSAGSTTPQPVIHWDRDFNDRAVCGATEPTSLALTSSAMELVTCAACWDVIDSADHFDDGEG